MMFLPNPAHFFDSQEKPKKKYGRPRKEQNPWAQVKEQETEPMYRTEDFVQPKVREKK